MALLGIDIGLDVLSVARPRGVWPAWSVLLRMACGIGYLAIFMAYIGMGRVFPDGYTYWGLSKGFCGPVVYLFLWLVGYVCPDPLFLDEIEAVLDLECLADMTLPFIEFGTSSTRPYTGTSWATGSERPCFPTEYCPGPILPRITVPLGFGGVRQGWD